MKLAACKVCRRQYDVSCYPEGVRFLCLCGESMRATTPEARDANFTRCAGCGAVLDEAAHVCAHCAADVPVLERGRSTICPECAARIPGDAHFCAACGIRIEPQALAPVAEDSRCPRCAGTMRTRELSPMPLVECGACLGVWLSVPTFESAVDKATTDPAPKPSLAAVPYRARAPKNGEPERRLLPCLICRDLMVPRHFGGRSGVVIDLCGNHGVWLDHEELERIVDWVRSGGLAAAERDERERDRRHEETAKPLGGADLSFDLSRSRDRTAFDWLEVLASLFVDRR